MKRTYTKQQALAELDKAHRREFDSMRERHQRELRRTEMSLDLLDRLATELPESVGEEPDMIGMSVRGPSLIVMIDREDLRAVREVAGNLSEHGKWLRHGSSNEVGVLLRGDRLPDVTFCYYYELQSDDPCHVVEETKTERKLVCRA